MVIDIVVSTFGERVGAGRIGQTNWLGVLDANVKIMRKDQADAAKFLSGQNGKLLQMLGKQPHISARFLDPLQNEFLVGFSFDPALPDKDDANESVVTQKGQNQFSNPQMTFKKEGLTILFGQRYRIKLVRFIAGMPSIWQILGCQAEVAVVPTIALGTCVKIIKKVFQVVITYPDIANVAQGIDYGCDIGRCFHDNTPYDIVARSVLFCQQNSQNYAGNNQIYPFT